MGPPNNPTIPPVADANYSRTFDPWNSVGAGHQRADGRGPGGWRDARDLKLRGQFAAGHAGALHGAAKSAAGTFPSDDRPKAGKTIADLLRTQAAVLQNKNGSSGSNSSGNSNASSSAAAPSSCRVTHGGLPPAAEKEMRPQPWQATSEERLAAAWAAEDEQQRGEKEQLSAGRRILDGLVVYVNGSTHPAISDHRLKRVLVENGARVSMHLGRRQVTHVILGRPARPGVGAGGGLAGGKLEREIRRVGGCGVKYVGVEWCVLEPFQITTPYVAPFLCVCSDSPGRELAC